MLSEGEAAGLHSSVHKHLLSCLEENRMQNTWPNSLNQLQSELIYLKKLFSLPALTLDQHN